MIPAKHLPEASEYTSAFTKILESFFQGDPLFCCKKYTQIYNSSLTFGETNTGVEFLTHFLVSDFSPVRVIAAYWCLVYHIPAGTAHSGDTNFPTLFSTSE